MIFGKVNGYTRWERPGNGLGCVLLSVPVDVHVESLLADIVRCFICPFSIVIVADYW